MDHLGLFMLSAAIIVGFVFQTRNFNIKMTDNINDMTKMMEKQVSANVDEKHSEMKNIQEDLAKMIQESLSENFKEIFMKMIEENMKEIHAYEFIIMKEKFEKMLNEKLLMLPKKFLGLQKQFSESVFKLEETVAIIRIIEKSAPSFWSQVIQITAGLLIIGWTILIITLGIMDYLKKK